jgi:hypothetical protein
MAGEYYHAGAAAGFLPRPPAGQPDVNSGPFEQLIRADRNAHTDAKSSALSYKRPS